MNPMNESHGHMNNMKQKNNSSHSGEQNIPTDNGGNHEQREEEKNQSSTPETQDRPTSSTPKDRLEHTAESSAHRSRVSFSTRAENKLKDQQDRMFLHCYDLKIETKKMDSEAECENLINKQLNLFFSIILQADNSTIIPPYLLDDRQVHGIRDISAHFPVSNIKDMASLKRYFHRLFSRADLGQFYWHQI
jgi:cobalamin biosynthesis protein CobT